MDRSPPIENGLKGKNASLATRLVLVILCLIILPIGFYTLITYERLYQTKLNDMFEYISVLENDQLIRLERFAHFEYRMLRLIDDVIMAKKGQESALLKEYSEKEIAHSIFYTTKNKEGKYICTDSSDPTQIGEDFTLYLESKEFQTQGTYTFITSNFYQNLLIYFSVATTTGSINLTLTTPYLLNRISTLQKNLLKPASLSVFTQDGEVIASTDGNLLHKIFLRETNKPVEIASKDKGDVIYFTPNKTRKVGYEFRFQGVNRYAVIRKIPHMPFYLVLDVKENLVFEEIRIHFIVMGLLLLGIVLLGIIGAYVVSLFLSKPFNKLCYAMRQVGKGDLQKRYIPSALGFEINVIGNIFNNMINSMLLHIDEAKKERIKKEIFEQELLIGQQIQKSLLPEQVPDFPGVDISAGFLSAKNVGGDFSDFFVLDPNRLMLCIADSSGKGVFACFYSLGVRTLIRSSCLQSPSLGEALVQTNRLFCMDTHTSSAFTTAFVAFLDKRSQKLTFANCGHLPAILKKSNGIIEELSTENIALGVDYELDAIATQEVQLEKGDTLILYTDGITDALNAEDAFFGKDKLLQIIQQPHVTAQSLVDNLLTELTSFSRTVPQYDDITLIVLKIL